MSTKNKDQDQLNREVFVKSERDLKEAAKKAKESIFEYAPPPQPEPSKLWKALVSGVHEKNIKSNDEYKQQLKNATHIEASNIHDWAASMMNILQFALTFCAKWNMKINQYILAGADQLGNSAAKNFAKGDLDLNVVAEGDAIKVKLDLPANLTEIPEGLKDLQHSAAGLLAAVVNDKGLTFTAPEIKKSVRVTAFLDRNSDVKLKAGDRPLNQNEVQMFLKQNDERIMAHIKDACGPYLNLHHTPQLK